MINITMVNTVSQALANFAGVSPASRPNYKLTCRECETVKTLFPFAMPSANEIAVKQESYTCRSCRNLAKPSQAKVETAPRPKVAKVESIARPKVASQPRAENASTVNLVAANATPARGSKLKMIDLIALGKIKAGDVVTILNKENSHAIVIDAKTVNLAGEILTWNKYGEAITGHVAVNIYKHALVNGVLLETLR